MTSLQYVQTRLDEAVRTSQERSHSEQRELLARLLAVAFAASRQSSIPV